MKANMDRLRVHPIAAQMENITPEKAEQWLRTMTGNRKPSDKKIIEYGIMMEKGEWIENGSTIVFDEQGHLIDGQQRLRGCILAGVAFRSLVVRGVDGNAAFPTIDTGKGRTHADVFAIGGWQNNQTAASAAMGIYLIKNGLVDWNGVRNKRMKRTSEILKRYPSALPSFDVVSRDQLRDFAEQIRSELELCVRFANASKAKRVIGGANVATLHFLFRQHSVTMVEQFFADLGEGLGLKAGDPVHVLREKLAQASKGAARLTRWYILGLCIKAWNARREDRDVRILRQEHGEEYPKIK